MRILGVDFETTGLNVEQDQIIEIGACLWETDGHYPIEFMSRLVLPNPDGIELSEEVTRVTGITSTLINENGIPPAYALTELTKLAKGSEAFVAHNGTMFDKPLFLNEAGRHATDLAKVPSLWIDTRMDVPYPDHFRGRSLNHLAADHGFLNPFAHRAVFDVVTMLKILSKYPIETVIERAKSPTIRVVAAVSFQKKDAAKAKGYYWDGTKKEWFKPLKSLDWEKELKHVGGDFQIQAQTELGEQCEV